MRMLSKENVAQLLKEGKIQIDRNFFGKDFDSTATYSIDFGNLEDGRTLTFYGCRVLEYDEHTVTLSLKDPEYIYAQDPPAQEKLGIE